MSEETSNRPPPIERTETDTTGEFFSVGAPLHAVRAGYVARKADQLLYDAVVSGRYAHVLAPARSGKSSLVAATAARLEGGGQKSVEQVILHENPTGGIKSLCIQEPRSCLRRSATGSTIC